METQASTVWLAAAKLAAPSRRKDTLTRPRLISTIGSALEQYPLILISAPAGAGKTTLLADLPESFPETTWCWLLLDEEDNDPSRFAAVLAASLAKAGITIEEDSFRPADARRSLTAIVNRITQTSERKFVLVLDDLHLIFESAVHELLEFVINNLPVNLRLIAASRHDPPLGMARRRARGDVAEMRFQDLSFREDETYVFANQRLSLNLTAEQVRQLHSRTEGWAAGLRLLAASMAQNTRVCADLLQSEKQGSRHIFDFLAEEVLDRQEPDLRSFLLETSILSVLTADVCNAMTGREDSHSVLESLYRRSLFVVAADQTETTFRYHDLFADFLKDRLRHEHSGQWAELHRRAARSETSSSNRLRHWLAAEEWDAAAAEIEAIGPEYARRGFVLTLRRWITDIPETARLRRPRILYLLGHAIWTQSEFAEAQPYLEQALEGFRRNQDIAGQAEALVALANSAVMNNRFDESREMIREALTFDIPGAARVQLYSASAWDAIYRQDWTEAFEHLDQVIQMVKSGAALGNPMALMLVLFAMGLPHQVAKIESVCTVMRLRLSGPPDLTHGCYYLLNSAVLFNRGDVAGSYQDALKSLAIARDCGLLLLRAALSTTFWLRAAVLGNWEEMETWSNDSLEGDKYGQVIRNWRLHSLYQQARARWHAGDVEGLRLTHEEAMRPNAVEAPAALPYRSLICGMLCLAERKLARSEQTFREAVSQEEAFKVTRAISSARVMLAYTLLLRARPDDAMECFKPQLDDAVAFNLSGYLIRESPHVIPLLRRAHQRGIHSAFVERVIGMLGADLNPNLARGCEALSEREMEVLLVMAEGLANRDVAQRLFVSEATVKTHVQHIMRKLDAKTRTQAVARARELMLL